jgi:hypothetical protein
MKLDLMKNPHAFLSDATIQGRLCLHMDNNQLTQTRDMSNINYIAQNTAECQVFSKQFLNHHLGTLQLSCLGGLEDRCAHVLVILQTYDEVASCAATVAAGNHASAFISLCQGIPCILHLGNHCSKKFLKMLLLEGYKALPTNSAKIKFLKDFETLVNSCVLETLTWLANLGESTYQILVGRLN